MVAKLTPTQEQEVIELFDDGHGFKVKEIAEAYGRSVVTITNIINRGVPNGRAGARTKRAPATSNDPGGPAEPVHA